MDDLLTPGQVAEILGVSERRVQQYCLEGRLGSTFGAGEHRQRYIITRKDAESFAAGPTGRPKSVA